ncbi:hypothetical protein Tco_1475173 [Tanacetum coccineum]
MYDLQDERQDQTEDRRLEPRRSNHGQERECLTDNFVFFMVENEHTSYEEAANSLDTVVIMDAFDRHPACLSRDNDEIGYLELKDSRSTSRICVYHLEEAAISWKSSKQIFVIAKVP